MRNYFLALPIIALSACSALEQPFVNHTSGTTYGQYDQGCSAGICAPGQSYSVAGQNHSAQGHQGVNPNHWPDQKLVSGYESGGAFGQGPVHVNPTGYGPQGPHHAGAYGQRPQLRGLRGPKRDYFYGTLGGVLYDNDLDSFGLQGRVGYDSGRGFFGSTYGAEIEGSIGLSDESLSDAVGFTDITSGFEHNIGAYVVSRLPITNRFSVHSRVGYNSQKLGVDATDVDGNVIEDTVTLDGLSIGLGAEYAVSPRSGVRIDYTETDTDFGGATKGFAASYTRKF